MKKRINLILLLTAAFFFFRFLVFSRGETADGVYLFSVTLFRGLSVGFYRFYANGVPFFGMSLGKVFSDKIKYLLPAPVFSGDAGLLDFSAFDFAVLFAVLVVFVAINRKKRPFDGDEDTDEDETEGCIEDDEAKEDVKPAPDDKSVCPKCGSRIFGENMYCENCGAKRKE